MGGIDEGVAAILAGRIPEGPRGMMRLAGVRPVRGTDGGYTAEVAGEGEPRGIGPDGRGVGARGNEDELSASTVPSPRGGRLVATVELETPVPEDRRGKGRAPSATELGAAIVREGRAPAVG